MHRTGRAYEKPSRISQGLVVGLSLAVVLMAGWLAISILLSHYTTSAAGDADMTGAPATGAPVFVENASPEPDEPRAAARVNSAYLERSPRDYASTTRTPPRPALPLASFAEPPPAVTRDPGYAPSPIATAAPSVNYRSIPAKEPPSSPPPLAGEGRLEARPAIEVTDAIADFMRLPPRALPFPPPRAGEGRVASIPIPRPRPRVEGEDAQPIPDQSPFDLLINRQR